MASVFVMAGVMMMFAIVRDPPPEFQPILKKFPPGGLVMSVVVLSYPIWGVLGALMGLLYKISTEEAPGSGIGSPNLVFTLGVVVVSVMMTAPFMVLLRRVLAGVLAITVASIGVFGWFLPYFAG